MLNAISWIALKRGEKHKEETESQRQTWIARGGDRCSRHVHTFKPNMFIDMSSFSGIVRFSDTFDMVE